MDVKEKKKYNCKRKEEIWMSKKRRNIDVKDKKKYR